METEIAPSAAIPTPAVIDPTEEHLEKEITALWQSHSQAQGAVRKTREELKLIRASLGARLHELKSVLSCPGRAGQWSGFLASEKIPRSTADRLASAHAKTIGQDENSTSGASKPLSDDGIAQVAKTTWARLQGKLGTNKEIYLFFSRLISESGIPFETFDDGILILLPEPAQGSSAQIASIPSTEADACQSEVK